MAARDEWHCGIVRRRVAEEEKTAKEQTTAVQDALRVE